MFIRIMDFIMALLFGFFGLVFTLGMLTVCLLFVLWLADFAGFITLPRENDRIAWGALKSTIGGGVGSVSGTLIFRFAVIAVLTLLMTIPLAMVKDIVKDRSMLHRGVLNEISGIWGRQQALKGPSILVPYTEKFVTEVVLRDKDGKILVDKDGFERKVNKTRYTQRTAIFLPDDLKIKVNLGSQTRQRSLYKAQVYTADIEILGQFGRPNIAGLSRNIDKIHWNSAWFALGISDTRAINKVSPLRWHGADNSAQMIDFEPGTRIVNVIKNGFHAPLALEAAVTGAGGEKVKPNYRFSFKINVNGSRGLFFSPFGKTTTVNIASDWPHPSFQGNVLPDSHDISAQGFKALWTVPHLARNYPQLWTLETQNFNINEFSAGVNLFESVSLYSQITRAIKYGILFIGLTYITFLIFELGIGRRLHVVQYAMIGLALTMFYLTLLSMAEHAGFLKAYIAAAGIIIILVSLYAYAAIRKVGSAVMILAMLSGLYALLYSLLQLEDYALLAGTGLLLVILAVMMYMTRNIGRESQKEVE